MGLALLAIIWLITFFSTYFFVAKPWWLLTGLLRLRHSSTISSPLPILMGIVFVAAQGALGLFVWQYRERSELQKWSILTAIPSSKCSGRFLQPCSLWA